MPCGIGRNLIKPLIKKVVKEVFNTFGFQIHRSQIRRSLGDCLDHVKKMGFKPQTIVDVGAAYGTFELYENFPDTNHLLVEPLKEWEKNLRNITQKYKAQYIIAAAGDKPGNAVINVHPDLTGSSFFKEIEGSHVDGIPREVPVVTIDSLCKDLNLKGPYLIKVDVQGCELLVLDGARKVMEETELLILEVSLFRAMINNPQLDGVVSYMKDHGFVVYDIFNFCYRPLDDALGQIDMAFVKENSQFRKNHAHATREQREELTERERLLVDSLIKTN